MPKTEYKTEWDLTQFYKGIDDPQIDADIKKSIRIHKTFADKWRKNDKYLSNPIVLKKALDELEKIHGKDNFIAKAHYYILLLSALDQDNDKYKKLKNKISNVLNDLSNEIEFFTNQLSHLGFDKIIDLSKAESLKNYKHYLEMLANTSKYQLSEAEEKVINLTAKTSTSNWTSMVSALLSTSEGLVINEKNEKIKLPFNELMNQLMSDNKITRDSAAKSIDEILRNYSKIAENEINSVFEYDQNIRKLRRILSPNLSRFLEDDIDPKTVETLIEVISSNYEIAHRYYELKAKLTKNKKLAYYERNIPIGKIIKKYTDKESIEIVSNTLLSLDPSFKEIFASMINSGQIDFYPHKGKKGGAFCTYYNKENPIYVLLNFDGTMNSITTLAHEMGHAINDHMMLIQNELHYSTPLSTAEVASTFIEDFTLREISKSLTSNEDKLVLLMEKLNDDISTIFRQTACYQFELDLHKQFEEKHYLGLPEIGDLFNKYMKKCNGPFVIHDKNSANWWIHWSHIRHFFYVYSYASGQLISKAMQNKTRQNPKFIDKVKVFLSAGSSKSPKDIFMDMGIDITDKSFWEAGLKEVENSLDEAYALAKKLGKI